MNKEKIAKINELYKKQKEGTLTSEEKELQTELRAEYIKAFRENLKSQLDNTYILREDGTKEKLAQKADSRRKEDE
ncbi:MAG TPA: DUF896 domain-containing protein [Christensenellaceae bacterium]|nr:DUF896 domain-containing protein [Christensenellaceae bacterium]